MQKTIVDDNAFSTIKAAGGVDSIVNALPIRFAPIVPDAELAVKANYQDFAATDFVDMSGISQMVFPTYQ